MKLKYHLSTVLCLLPGIAYSMNIVKSLNPTGNAELISIFFNKKQPSDVLKNNKTFEQERNEKFDALTKIVSPKVLTFIQGNPDDKTAQAMNRSLNLVASKMAFFIGENAPVLDQDISSQEPRGNPVLALFNRSAKASRDTIALLLDVNYFLDNETFLKEKFVEQAEMLHKAFLKSVEQLGMDLQEMVYIDEGRVITDAQAKEMTSGIDILGGFAAREEFFNGFKIKIKKTKAIDFVDEMADITTAGLLKKSDVLQQLREKAVKASFGTSQDTILKILIDEQAGCSFNSKGGFAFDCKSESQQMVYAIVDHKAEMLQKIHDNVCAIRIEVQTFEIDQQIAKFFTEECREIEELIERAQERCKKLELILPEDAKAIGPRAYALSNLYGTIRNLAKNKNDKNAESLVLQSRDMYNFIRMQE